MPIIIIITTKLKIKIKIKNERIQITCLSVYITKDIGSIDVTLHTKIKITTCLEVEKFINYFIKIRKSLDRE